VGTLIAGSDNSGDKIELPDFDRQFEKMMQR
jgi:hypothetical protein